MHLLWGFFLLSWQNSSSSYAQKEAKIAFSILKVYTIICIKQYRGRYFIETFLPPIYTTAALQEKKKKKYCWKQWQSKVLNTNRKSFYHKRFMLSLFCCVWSIKWLLNVFIFNVISICERCANNNIIVTIKKSRSASYFWILLSKTPLHAHKNHAGLINWKIIGGFPSWSLIENLSLLKCSS